MVLLLLLLQTALAATGPAAAADLDGLVRLLEAVHPALHRHMSSEDWRRVVLAERERLAGMPEVDDLAMGRALHRVLAPVGDGHLAVGLPLYQPSSTAPVSLLPVLPRQVEGKVLIDAGPPDLPPGTELLAIEGVPVRTLYAELGALVLVDGRAETAVLRALEFDLPRYYALYRGMADTYRLQVRLPDGSEQEITARGLDRGQTRTLREQRRVAAWWGSPTPDGLPVLRRETDGTAILRAPTFGIMDMEAYARRVDALFAEIRGAPRLVIDLRGNEGGLRPNGMAILNHLLPGPYQQWSQMRVIVRSVPKRLRKELSWPFGLDRDVLAATFPGRPGDGAWIRPGDPLQARMIPHPDRYPGPVVVLVDGRTTSAANTFVLALKRFHPDVTLVGEPLGGACDRHTGELPTVWTGPETEARVMLSLIDIGHVEVPGCQPGKGLSPDILVRPTVEGFQEGRDPFLERALQP